MWGCEVRGDWLCPSRVVACAHSTRGVCWVLFPSAHSSSLWPPPPGAVSRSSLKQPKSCNIFKALFCCLQAQDGPKLPPPPPPPPPPSSQHALLESQENGTVVKVTHYSHSHRDLQPWKAVLRARFTTYQPSIVNRVLEKTSFKLNKKIYQNRKFSSSPKS